MQDNADIDDLVRMLAWYGEAGVDCAVGEAPVDWLARGPSPPGADFIYPDIATGAQSTGPATAPMRPAARPEMRPETRPAMRAPLETHGAAAPGRPPAPPQQARRPAATPAEGARPPPARFATAPPDAAETEARRIAASVGDLAGLAAALSRFDGCALKATAKSTCVFRGAERARLMIIGEAPGRDEDLEGRPFVGRAGQLLDRMLKAIDLDETSVHITNVVYWRPPGNRTPTAQETQVCRPFLERQLQLVEPELMLLLGGAAAKAMLDTADGIMKLRGKWREAEIGGRKVRTMATLHPAYLLRTPASKRLAWRDLLAVKKEMGSPRN